jgi:hypothetical protein
MDREMAPIFLQRRSSLEEGRESREKDDEVIKPTHWRGNYLFVRFEKRGTSLTTDAPTTNNTLSEFIE